MYKDVYKLIFWGSLKFVLYFDDCDLTLDEILGILENRIEQKDGDFFSVCCSPNSITHFKMLEGNAIRHITT